MRVLEKQEKKNDDDVAEDANADDDAVDAECRLNGKLLGKLCVQLFERERKREGDKGAGRVALENYLSTFNMLSRLDGITVKARVKRRLISQLKLSY